MDSIRQITATLSSCATSVREARECVVDKSRRAFQRVFVCINTVITSIESARVSVVRCTSQLFRQVHRVVMSILWALNNCIECLKTIAYVVYRVAKVLYLTTKCLVQSGYKAWKGTVDLYTDLSKRCYHLAQRVVALMLFPCQRFRFSWFKMRALDNRFVNAQCDIPMISDVLGEGYCKGSDATKFQPVKIERANGLKLEGVLMGQKNNIVLTTDETLEGVQGPLVVVYPGIGGCYQSWSDIKAKLPKLYAEPEEFAPGSRIPRRSTLLMVNYRGVCRSQGYLTNPDDLFADGLAIALYAKSLLQPGQEIYFYGFSMGGAVTTHVVSTLEAEDLSWQATGVVIDRSYSKLSSVAYEGMLPYVRTVFTAMINYTGWDIDSEQAALKIKRSNVLVINTTQDGVIRPKASLATALEERPDFCDQYPNFTLVNGPVTMSSNPATATQVLALLQEHSSEASKPLEARSYQSTPPCESGRMVYVASIVSKLQGYLHAQRVSWGSWWKQVCDGVEHHSKPLHSGSVDRHVREYNSSIAMPLVV